MARKALIQFRRDTAAVWAAANPVLASGEPGFETDTRKEKLGDGVTLWNALAYSPPASLPAMHGVRVGNSIAQSLLAASSLVPTFDTERYDTDGYHAGGAAALVVPAALGGYYRIGATFRLASVVDASVVYAYLLVNGTPVATEIRSLAANELVAIGGLCAEYYLNVGDSLTLQIDSAVTANARDLKSDANSSPEFWMSLIGV